MNYYHGSPIFFKEFDKNVQPLIHLTPHIDYAMNFALKDDVDYGYLYEISVEGYEDKEYNEGMVNMTIQSDSPIIKIVDIKRVYRDSMNFDGSSTFIGMEEIGYCGNCGKEDSLDIIENPLIGCERCGHKS